ncbi:hypothetical protein NDU88_000635 [Pleurodeles waltl]|uniref:Uncharacterized protein n=1 Tax=Pleurodeles waltl TaxID=8319 RepID=A0AAV7UTM8_PLEWA|nr:hypothetical protein NDU88_000635 [Pleurodeles waltl]
MNETCRGPEACAGPDPTRQLYGSRGTRPGVALLIVLVPGPGPHRPISWWRTEGEARCPGQGGRRGQPCVRPDWGALGRNGVVGRGRLSGPEIGPFWAAGYAAPATLGGARAAPKSRSACCGLLGVRCPDDRAAPRRRERRRADQSGCVRPGRVPRSGPTGRCETPAWVEEDRTSPRLRLKL